MTLDAMSLLRDPGSSASPTDETPDASSAPGPCSPPAPSPVAWPSLESTARVTRRSFVRAASGLVAASGLGSSALAQQSRPNQQEAVKLPRLHAASEAPEKPVPPSEPAAQRVGFAVVGLGHLAINQILPAFGTSKHCKVTALVSGDREKAQKIAAQYGVPGTGLYDYSTYDKLADNPDVQVIYIVLPNSMHAEYVVRGAKARKHILCEKPMATSVQDCERMIAACKQARVKLMIAYRQQYEPMNRAIVKMRKDGKLGTLKSYVATNGQNQGDPNQWRQNLKLAGGGCLPDVGIYCLNAARFLSGEEPAEVWGTIYQPREDPRFREVEETCTFGMRFPSGLIAVASSGYGSHRSQMLRLEGDRAWAELSPAFGYSGLKLRTSTVVEGQNVTTEPSVQSKDQFATEMDHMASCVQGDRDPHTPGEEGLQDQRITDAIYEAARTGKVVKLSPPSGPTRGPEPSEES